ncbi:MAG: hypothetical protein K2X77_17365, partial [Candidatus Obscuribacterales bacterium]|nr:hypothetical protein [Candidatus Obscuribacterales bacterium]
IEPNQTSESLSKARSRQDAGAPGIEPNQTSESLSKARSRQDAGAPGIEPNQTSESLSKARSQYKRNPKRPLGVASVRVTKYLYRN